MMLEGAVVSLTLRTTRRRWRFPAHPFVEWEDADERRALELGWSPWGGEEYAAEVTVSVPRAVVTAVTKRGVTFRALPDYGEAAL